MLLFIVNLFNMCARILCEVPFPDHSSWNDFQNVAVTSATKILPQVVTVTKSLYVICRGKKGLLQDICMYIKIKADRTYKQQDLKRCSGK